MKKDNTKQEPDGTKPSNALPASRRPYATPKLHMYGDLRDVTLGGTPGTNDTSGNFSVQDPLGT